MEEYRYMVNEDKDEKIQLQNHLDSDTSYLSRENRRRKAQASRSNADTQKFAEFMVLQEKPSMS